MITNKPTKIISLSSAVLVFPLAAGAFTLSFSNLWDTALSHGLPPRLAWIWPLLVDFALVVFSLAVVRASLYNERTWWPWLMVGVYTVGTVTFNVIHAPANLTAQVIAVVAPVSLFLSFETLMNMLKSGVKRAGLVQSIAEIEAEMKRKAGALDRLQREWQTEMDALTANRQSELANLEAKIAQLQDEVELKAKTLDSYLQDIEAKKQELKGLTGGLTKTYLPANLSLEQKQDLANQMAGDGLTNEQIKDALGVSLATVKNYKKANRQIISPEEVEGTIARNGHRKG